MNKFFILIFISTINVCVKAQAPAAVIPATQPYGTVSKEDLELKECDFEKDANAMVLFNKGDVYYDQDFKLIGEYHKRIKIFNDKGKDAANIRIEFYGGHGAETIYSVDAETINSVNGKAEITRLDKSLLYLEHTDKNRFAWVFTMPNVKAGSVIEFKYRWNTQLFYNFPSWNFQDRIPTRYSEIHTEIPEMLTFKAQLYNNWGTFCKNTSSAETRTSGTGSSTFTYNDGIESKAMANVPSLPYEPYMGSYSDNLRRIVFELVSSKPLNGIQNTYSGTWPLVGGNLINNDDFGSQLNKKLTNEEGILEKAATLKTDDEKIAYVFNYVKNAMRWNGVDRWYTNEGTVKAWDNKAGNSTEINLILYHLLKKCGVKARPMVVSTRDFGKVKERNPTIYQFNRAVVYIPIDSTNYYVLDAANKFNIYNQVPSYLLNSTGLEVDKESKTYQLFFLDNKQPAKESETINAQISPDGKINGTIELYSVGYNRTKAIEQYKTDGEKKYIGHLQKGENRLIISSIKFDNMEVDSLPLMQNMNFTFDAGGSDGNYIYIKPGITQNEYANVFLSEKRYTDIDFAYLNIYSINCSYKLPVGYKIDVAPKNVNMNMPDNSIVFKRVVATQDDMVIVRYMLNFKQAIYHSIFYQNFREFFKKMNEMMDEQIVLKKM